MSARGPAPGPPSGDIRPRAGQRVVSRTEAMLFGNLRASPLFQELVGAEAGIGWPIPVRREGRVFLTVPLFGQRVSGRPEEPVELYPPFAKFTFEWRSFVPVEYVDFHRYGRPWPKEAAQGPVGTFPHDSVRGPRADYEAKRSELLARYDELFEVLASNGRFAPDWLSGFGSLLRTLLEPGLEPYYRALGPKFFETFLDGQTAAS